MRGLLQHLTTQVSPHTLATHIWDHGSGGGGGVGAQGVRTCVIEHAVELLVLCARWGVGPPQAWIVALLEVRGCVAVAVRVRVCVRAYVVKLCLVHLVLLQTTHCVCLAGIASFPVWQGVV